MGGSLGPVVQAVPAVQERSIEIQIRREGVRRLLGIGMTTGSRARIRARCCSLKNTDIRGRERRPVGRPHLLPRLLPHQIAVVRIIVRPANIPAPCASRKSIVTPAAREAVTGAVIKTRKTEVWIRRVGRVDFESGEALLRWCGKVLGKSVCESGGGLTLTSRRCPLILACHQPDGFDADAYPYLCP